MKTDWFCFQKCLSICGRKNFLKDFVWKSNSIYGEKCHELDKEELEYSYDLWDSTLEDEIPDFSSKTP